MIKIVTDSTAYLPSEYVQEHDIRVVPLNVLFGERSYKEGVELSNEEFYRMLAEAPALPTTSQPAVGDFHKVYSELAAAGHQIVSIHISSKLSGTVDSALAAKQMLPEATIAVVDSLLTSVGLELVVRAAVEAAEAGRSYEQVVDLAQRVAQSTRTYFVVDTLEYLQKGGRIGGAAAFLGTLLKVKPILCLKDGRVEPVDKVRTRKKALRRLLDLMEGDMGVGTPVRAAVVHAQALEEGKALVEKVRSRLNCSFIYLAELGPVIGTHTGPGTLGLAAHSEAVLQG